MAQKVWVHNPRLRVKMERRRSLIHMSSLAQKSITETLNAGCCCFVHIDVYFISCFYVMCKGLTRQMTFSLQ